jgi:hypothetical protein
MDRRGRKFLFHFGFDRECFEHLSHTLLAGFAARAGQEQLRVDYFPS